MKAYRTEFVSLFSGIAFLALLAFTSSAYAGPGPKGEADAPAFVAERMADRLGLDDTQRQEIENIILAAQPEFQALRDRVQADIESVLTDEQLAQLEADKQRMKQRVNRAIDGRRGERGSRSDSE